MKAINVFFTVELAWWFPLGWRNKLTFFFSIPFYRWWLCHHARIHTSVEFRLPWRPPRIRRNVPSFGHHYWRLLEEGRPRNAPHGHGHRQWDTLPLPPPPPNNNNHHHPLMEIKKTQSFHIMYSIVSFWGKFMTKFFLVIYKASPNCNAFLVSKLINMYKCVLKIRTLYQSI